MAFSEYQHLMQKRSYLLIEGDIQELTINLLKCYYNLPRGVSTEGLDKTKGLESRV